jgi:hypothetical protein
VRDSAGVRIVENSARRSAPIAFQLGTRPSFDVGGPQPDSADTFIAANYYLKGARLSDGRVVVIDRSRVHFFSPSGKPLRIVGREGEQPGEFRQATDVCVTRGDTILVGAGHGFVNRLTGNGDPAGAILPLGSGYAEGDFCFGDGTFVTQNRLGFDLTKPTPMRATRYSFSRQLNAVADFVYPIFDQIIPSEVGFGARGSRFYVSEPTAFEIRGYSTEGKLEIVIRTADSLVAITDAEKEMREPAAHRAGASLAEMEADRKEGLAKSKTRFWPTLQKLMIDGYGRIWIQEFTPDLDPAKPVAWFAFEADGTLLGRLVIPGAPSPRLEREVMGFGANEIFFKRSDADGTRHLTIVPVVPVRR